MQAIMMKKGATAAVSLAVLLALGACGDRVENTEMPQAEQASVEINRQGMEGAKADDMAQGVNNDTATMGAAPQAATIDPDVRIASDVQAALASHPDFGAVKIDVHSEDGKVTLRGQAPDPAAKERAAEVAGAVRDVKSVENQLTLG
ncbi:MAG: BON domain-containing protein [Variovorax sp.]|nr:MAG: BON domain-containing protein [Variovorax sp.]